MNSKRFVYLAIGCLLSGAVLLTAANMAFDEFGLFRSVEDRNIRIWGYERASKYLLSKRYIPERFDGVLIGPSVADIEMDTSKIRGYDIYNLAVIGGNICELKWSVDNVLDRGELKWLIVCMDPYLTLKCGQETGEINPKLVQSTFGSLFTVRYYAYKLWTKMHPDRDGFVDSLSGYRVTDERHRNRDRKKAILSKADVPLIKCSINETAFQTLEEILQRARAKGIRIAAYYYPIPQPIYVGIEDKYQAYKKRVSTLFKPDDVVVDMNSQQYAFINSDFESYSDGTHLSPEGADKVLSVVATMIGGEMN